MRQPHMSNPQPRQSLVQQRQSFGESGSHIAAATDTQASVLPTYRGAQHIVRWFVPLGTLLALAGYWGPWIDHAAAGLIISGLDLAEYVKFLPQVRSGELQLWREGYYLPLIVGSLILSLAAYRPRFAYSYPVRLALILVAFTAASNILPPAWSPAILLTAEFRLQTAIMALCLLLALCSPFLALLPLLATRILVTGLALVAMTLPFWLFSQVWPAIGQLYAAPLQLGWGPMLLLAGFGLCIAGWWLQPATPNIPVVNEHHTWASAHSTQAD